MKKIIVIPAVLVIALAVCGFLLRNASQDSQEPKEIYILQQHSLFKPEWHDVTLVFGFAENGEPADVVLKAFQAAYPNREYRLVPLEMAQSKYDRLKLVQK